MRIPVLLALALTVSPGIFAEVTEKLDYTEVEIKADEGGPGADPASPASQNEVRLHSDMKWGVRWNFRFAERKGKCRITRINTHVAGKATIPKLIGGTAEQKLELERFVTQQKAVHHDLMGIGRAAANEIEQRVVALPPALTCKALQTQAHDTAEKIMDDYNEKSESYRSGEQGS
jgi:predicted secreted Zn-dependent protease